MFESAEFLGHEESGPEGVVEGDETDPETLEERAFEEAHFEVAGEVGVLLQTALELVVFAVVVPEGESVGHSCRQTANHTQQLVPLNPAHRCEMSHVVVYNVDHVHTGG